MITNWLIAFGTVILAIVAIFQDHIRAKVARPKLKLVTSASSPCCQKIILKNKHGFETDGYFLRLCIKNKSKKFRANQVEVFASELLVKRQDGRYYPYQNFEPINLVWSHLPDPPIIGFLPFADLSPEMERYCFIGRILNPNNRSNFPRFNDEKLPPDKTCLALAVQVERFNKYYIIPHGSYWLKCSIGGENIGLLKKTIELEICGDWYENETEMFGKGFDLKLLD
jgi:hypothetical protein